MKLLMLAVRGLKTVARKLGVGPDTTSHADKCISALGAALGMLLLCGVLRWYVSDHTLTLLLASIAATSVLVFAVPHGALSQPWPVLGGYLVSAFVGVSCQRWISEPVWAIGLAVGGAVLGMVYLRCLHPPGGAVALVAVTGGSDIQQLGYHFIWLPALANAAVLVGAGVIFNGLLSRRRCPVPAATDA